MARSYSSQSECSLVAAGHEGIAQPEPHRFGLGVSVIVQRRGALDHRKLAPVSRYRHYVATGVAAEVADFVRRAAHRHKNRSLIAGEGRGSAHHNAALGSPVTAKGRYDSTVIGLKEVFYVAKFHLLPP